MDAVDELTECGPFVHSPGWLDVSIFGVVGFVEFAEVHTFVATDYADVMHPANMVLILDVATFPQCFDGNVDVVYSTMQCCPSVTRKQKNNLETMDGDRWNKIWCILKLYI